jgi:hypothetical protein
MITILMMMGIDDDNEKMKKWKNDQMIKW